jgi:hypothetical protein
VRSTNLLITALVLVAVAAAMISIRSWVLLHREIEARRSREEHERQGPGSAEPEERGETGHEGGS